MTLLLRILSAISLLVPGQRKPTMQRPIRPNIFLDSYGRKIWTARWQPLGGYQAARGCVFISHGVNEHLRPYYDEVGR